MAKKKIQRKTAVPNSKAKAKLTARDKKTLSHIVGLADGVSKSAGKRRDPHVDVPTRSLSNVKYNRRKRYIEMGQRQKPATVVQSLTGEELYANDARGERL